MVCNILVNGLLILVTRDIMKNTCMVCSILVGFLMGHMKYEKHMVSSIVVDGFLMDAVQYAWCVLILIW